MQHMHPILVFDTFETTVTCQSSPRSCRFYLSKSPRLVNGLDYIFLLAFPFTLVDFRAAYSVQLRPGQDATWSSLGIEHLERENIAEQTFVGHGRQS